MSTDEYVPSEDDVRIEYVLAHQGLEAQLDAGEAYDRWLAAHDARVRRDAAREALDGLARLAVQIEGGHGRLMPAKRVRDDWAMVERAARNYRDTHYHEGADSD